eukprot:SAG22_NODE_888_length_6659_cov_13.876067_10_plen_175_part_00
MYNIQMSDTETPETVPKKAKRQLTPEQLEKLATAREKANAVRKEKAAAKKKEKELAQIKAKQRQQEVDTELASLQTPKVTPKSAPKQRKKKEEKIEAVIISDSDSDSSYSESSEEESSSSEEEVVYRKTKKKKAQPKAKRAKQANRGVHFVGNDVDEVYNHRMQQAFGSLFPQF